MAERALSSASPTPAVAPSQSIVKARAGLPLRLIYGFGTVAFGVKDNGFSSILLFFYNQVVGLSPLMSGAAIGVALFADAFIDPFIGQWSDNLRSRWGRRHPLMYASALPVAVSYLLLWSPPHVGQTGLFLYLTGVAILVRSFISFYEVPSSALAPELTTDYDERTSLLGLRMFFAWLGGLFMSFMAYAVFLKPDALHKIGQLNAVGYQRYGLTAAVVMAAAILISAVGTHHRIPTLTKAPSTRPTLPQMLRQMGEAMSNRSFLALLLSSLFSSAGTGLVFSLGIYFYTYLWGLSSGQVALFAFVSIAAIATSVVLAPVFSRWMGKRTATMLVFMIGVAFSITPQILRLLGLFVPNGSPALFPLLALFQYLTLSLAVAAAILGTSMMADVVEDSQVRTGRRSEGVFFAAAIFIQKAVTGIGIFVASLILALAGFPSGAKPGAPVPHDAVVRLSLIYLPSVVVLYGVASLILFGYRITKARHEDNLRTIAEAAAFEPAPPG